MNVNDKTVVVTGGASGIGQALSVRFANEGARVVVADLVLGKGATNSKANPRAGGYLRCRNRS